MCYVVQCCFTVSHLVRITRHSARMIKEMSDTTYEIFQNGQSYKVRITRLGNFIQEADGFASQDDAARWVAQHRRIAVIDEQKEPITSAHLRVVPL